MFCCCSSTAWACRGATAAATAWAASTSFSLLKLVSAASFSASAACSTAEEARQRLAEYLCVRACTEGWGGCTTPTRATQGVACLQRRRVGVQSGGRLLALPRVGGLLLRKGRRL